jgi:NAD(P)-dependent dehydrogenase (short-subunit alcohol dehydrogenase family)
VGRVALVTGASGGVGAAIARALAADGCDVALLGRDQARLAAAADAGAGAWWRAADLRDPVELAHAHADVVERLGPVDVLVCAAGAYGPIAPLAELDADQWAEVLALNVEAPLRLGRAVLPAMLARGWGRIVNVSSAAAVAPAAPLTSAYGTSKAALNRLTLHLASELAGTGVTAALIHPGEVRTAMWAEIRAASRAAGARDLVAWAEAVARTGGDPPERAAELVLRIVHDADGVLNGAFLGLPEVLDRAGPEPFPDTIATPWSVR